MDLEFEGVIGGGSCLHIVFNVGVLLDTLDIFNGGVHEQVEEYSQACNCQTVNFSNGKLLGWNDARGLHVDVRLVVASLVGCWNLGTDHVLETDFTVFLSSALSEQLFSNCLSCVRRHIGSAIDMSFFLDYFVNNVLVAVCEGSELVGDHAKHCLVGFKDSTRWTANIDFANTQSYLFTEHV